jgi:hypothetical protein
MNITTTLLFYLLLGVAVAVADYLAAATAGTGQQLFRLLTAFVFWPLYLPALLQRPTCTPAGSFNNIQQNFPPGAAAARHDDLAAAIQQVEAELDLALASLGGWSDAVVAREQHRFEELRSAWHAQADKIRELNALLGSMRPTPVSDTSGVAYPSERIAASYRVRQANIDRLQALCDQYRADLMNTLAWVRELVTMIHLARYTGAPASRAEELVMQIAMSIEGISEVARWHDAEEVNAAGSLTP